jgi:competence protein ComGC
MLELLVVVVIIGVLAAIAIPVMTTLRAYQVTSAADGKHMTNGQMKLVTLHGRGHCLNPNQ